MLLRDAIYNIKFNTSTVNQLNGKGTNAIFNERQIVSKLTQALDKYAAKTKAIEAIHSFPLGVNTKFVDAPPLALRSETYRMMIVYIDQRAYPLMVPNMNTTVSYFPYEISGVPRFILPWQDLLIFYPTDSNSYNTTTLTYPIDKTQTEITLDSVGGLIQKNGRLTIDEEVIRYQYITDTTLYGCTRGMQDTIAATHIKGAAVNENNCYLFYYKKHWRIPVESDDFIAPEYLNREMEVCDEHMELITDYTAAKLNPKVDVEKARFYEDNFDKFINESAEYIRRGRNKMSRGRDISTQFMWETQSYLGELI